ncbi:MAG: hypothetical protein CND26_04910 [Bacteroidetes bacterium MED-G13]|nr:MAG: hypothetical protein CND26_04910 [Bacteroidetes bacterium MED-G13]|tara:strand:+ start:2053 stop:2463 length:411 start_codon:yes stop_codon:yes gene_type:complete
MKRLIILFFFTLSCNNQINLDYINGYWEIVSVSKNNKFLKEYPFSNAVDFFVIDSLNNGFRKKIKPKIDGSFEITLHEIPISIKDNNKSFDIIYFSAGNQYVETINILDQNRLVIKNSEGIIFSYKRFEKYLNDGK